ncbi:MAG: hypothetical protein A3C30_03985 [Candidatus Levybacteria bacterium RIFCSPHIGHO2_02_FULL_40_18]|nr:MAG: hypothetical protein A2869_00605 [Candidatus Levybacteria bacterium RIFCSPHIGHO2_01_FULL_40_58]OGH26242.1 MAG: hypothetical protein A3C30_03985 [Candidatus Levybacteria bacterium RIFCSPHIGHO2_02_FULL_40_18]OGH31494.1 MAG: hypothetical protein A3E43_03025 [Candidatus Levybacteria bacterium RIFCSPHIGHO2_12_FULL_40_31]OGH40134.1 MAG: hypothetical protein A2894_04345 [Candidatus Levybacteria bacterium RIFCSPLOWO2_01_FULL_40_64]OGH49087.1 MAG: hypothetical protein A3I54_00770 [Candidatus Lev
MKKSRVIYASSIAAFINAVFVTAITISAELSVAFKSWLQEISGHHWVSKSILAMALYTIILLLVYTISQDVSSKKVRNAVYFATWSAFAGAIVIFAFFAGHHLKLY